MMTDSKGNVLSIGDKLISSQGGKPIWKIVDIKNDVFILENITGFIKNDGERFINFTFQCMKNSKLIKVIICLIAIFWY